MNSNITYHIFFISSEQQNTFHILFYCSSKLLLHLNNITFLFLVSRHAYEASVLSLQQEPYSSATGYLFFCQGCCVLELFLSVCTCTDWLMIVFSRVPLGSARGVLLWPPCPCCIIQQQPDTVVHHSQIQCSRRLFVYGIVLWTAVLCMNLIYMTVYSQY